MVCSVTLCRAVSLCDGRHHVWWHSDNVASRCNTVTAQFLEPCFPCSLLKVAGPVPAIVDNRNRHEHPQRVLQHQQWLARGLGSQFP